MSGIKIDLDHRPLPKASTFLDNRTRCINRMRTMGAKGALLVFGRPDLTRAHSDFEAPFRQESCFYWLNGVNEPNCAFYVDIATGRSVLFYPDLPEDLAIWTGPLPTLADLKAKYGVDETRLVPELAAFLAAERPATVYTLEATCDRALLDATGLPLNFTIALEAIGEERQLKGAGELELLRYACDVNCDAFYDTIRSVRPGMYAQQIEGALQHKYIDGYCRENAFATIVCVGQICATLHYHANTEKLRDGDLVLVDAGCEYFCYAADNTRTFPANGKFSEDQRLVYQAVLDAQKAVIAAAKPGVAWPDMAVLSARVMAEGLIRAGLFQNGTAEEIVEAGAMAVFYPHGLGHGMGLDCHEIAGWEPGHERPNKHHVSSLRMGRVLTPGIVVTVEPGCYFVPGLYEKAFQDPKIAKYINQDVCRRFRETVGGVRIEDDILITETGNENLSHIPKEIADLEALMAQK